MPCLTISSSSTRLLALDVSVADVAPAAIFTPAARARRKVSIQIGSLTFISSTAALFVESSRKLKMVQE